MKFEYPENEKLIRHLETDCELTDRAIRVCVRAAIANIRALAKESEKAAGKMSEKSGKEMLVKAVLFHERANELQAYLDERRRDGHSDY